MARFYNTRLISDQQTMKVAIQHYDRLVRNRKIEGAVGDTIRIALVGTSSFEEIAFTHLEPEGGIIIALPSHSLPAICVRSNLL